MASQIFQPLILFLTVVCLVQVSAFPSSKNGAIRNSFPGSADEVVDPLPLINFSLPFKHYSGYLDSIENIKLHYWFFESQNRPKTDPVVLLFGDVTGSSSLYYAFNENGPIRANVNYTFTLNPFSWNRNASLLYLETPIYVGFSIPPCNCSDLPDNTDERTAAQNFAALQSFFTVKFPHLRENPFYITGKGYSARFIPQLSMLLLKQQKSLLPHFKGVAIGSGFFDNAIDLSDQYQYTHAVIPGILNSENYLADCWNSILWSYNTWCDGISLMTDWMQRADVQRAIHIDDSCQPLPIKWKFIDEDFPYHKSNSSMAPKVKAMVDSGQLRVVIFSGDQTDAGDLMTTQKFIEGLGYTEDAPASLSECLSHFKITGGCTWAIHHDGHHKKTVVGGMGRTFQSGRLVFLTLRGAGFQAALDNPEASLTMLNQILFQLED